MYRFSLLQGSVFLRLTEGYMWHEIEREIMLYLRHNVIFSDTSQWKAKNRSHEMSYNPPCLPSDDTGGNIL